MQIRNHSERTIGQYISLIGKFFEWLGKPCVLERILTPKRPKALPDVMSFDEVLMLLAGYTHRVGIMRNYRGRDDAETRLARDPRLRRGRTPQPSITLPWFREPADNPPPANTWRPVAGSTAE